MLTTLRRARYGYLLALHRVSTRTLAEVQKNVRNHVNFDTIGHTVSGMFCVLDQNL
jgi:hypothetical protein